MAGYISRLLTWSTCVLMALGAASSAQAGDAGNRVWPLEVGVGAESVGFVPGHPHPLFTVGTEVAYDRTGVFHLLQGIGLDYSLQPSFLHGPGLGTSLIGRWTTSFGLLADLHLGAGYMMRFYGPETWIQDEDGEFQKGGNRPRSMYRVGLGASVGLDLSHRWGVPIRWTIGYEQVLALSVAPGAGFPILPQTTIGLRCAWLFGAEKEVAR